MRIEPKVGMIFQNIFFICKNVYVNEIVLIEDGRIFVKQLYKVGGPDPGDGDTFPIQAYDDFDTLIKAGHYKVIGMRANGFIKALKKWKELNE
jgi:hypothetical protein